MTDQSIKFSRRGLFLGAGAVAVSSVLGNVGIWQAHAAAPLQGPVRPLIYRFKLGQFEVTQILDGVKQVKDLYKVFGKDQKEEAVRELAKANYLPPAKFEASYTVTVVNTGKKLITFDTGNGPIRRNQGLGKLREYLPMAGYKPEDIDTVVITHGHTDHIGGLWEDGKPAFPNASYVIGQMEFDTWKAGTNIPERRKKVRELYMKLVAPLAEKAKFIKPGEDVVTGVTAVNSFGHSAGHMAYHLESEGKRLLIWADTTNHYVMSLQRPDWEVLFDDDKAMAAASRKRILDMVATDKIPAIGYHMPFPSVGFIEKAAEGYRWVPASYQLNL